MADEKRTVMLTMSVNGADAVDFDDHVVIPAVIAAEGVYDDDEGKAGYRNAEESRAMIPRSNSLRMMEKHPGDDLTQFIGADLMDPDFPVFGVTQNARESDTPGPNGEVRIAAELRVDKKDRAGNDRIPMINGMKDGSIKEISIQYFLKRVPQKGTYAGKNYDYLEVDVNPYGLGVMTDGWRAKCPPDTCAIGQSGEPGDDPMTDPKTPPAEGGEDKNATTLAAILAVAGTKCSDEVIEIVKGANANKKRVAELEAEKEAMDADRSELEKYRAEATKAEADKLEQAIEAMKARIGPKAYEKRYPAETDVTPAMLESDWEMLDADKPKEEPKEDTEDEPKKGENADPPGHPIYLKGTAGVKEPPASAPEDDEYEGRIPLPK